MKTVQVYLVALILAPLVAHAAPAAKPNIVYILADDK